MQNYELLVIISSKVTEEEIPFITDKLFELIKKNEGTIVSDKNIGKQKLAYPIDHQRYGFYVQVDFDLPGANLKNVEKELKLMDEVTRHIVVIRDVLAQARAAKREQEQKERKIPTPEPVEEKPAATPEAEPEKEKEVEKPAEEAPEKKEEKAKPSEPLMDPKPEKEAKPEKKKVSLEELDEKLDQLLDDDIMRT